ncbi:FkbM family methyltransferase [Humisphaera borealis]|nr:FkbM family methyltransferase [Humisphaera borealis]
MPLNVTAATSATSSAALLPCTPLWVKAASRLIQLLPFGRYRLMNAVGRRSAATFVAELRQDGKAYRFLCNLQDGIAREVCFTGMYEPQETLVLRQLLSPGQVLLDVGANWGYFTLLAAHCVGSAGRVISLEPDPRLFPQLQTNITLNRLAHVQAIQVAAADREGTMTLAGFDEAGENFGVSRLVANGDKVHGRCFPVRTASLDTILEEYNIDTVDVLKMDIEGAEGLALRGLEQSLSTHRVRRLLLEVHPHDLLRYGIRAEDILQSLTNFGYRCLRVSHDLRATRRAAYSRHLQLADILTPIDTMVGLDNWPHLLFLAPSIEL